MSIYMASHLEHEMRALYNQQQDYENIIEPSNREYTIFVFSLILGFIKNKINKATDKIPAEIFGEVMVSLAKTVVLTPVKCDSKKSLTENK